MLLVIAPAVAADTKPSFVLPIACMPGTSCWVANYVDADPSAAAADFRCGPRSYEAHDGVDIALRDLGEMRRGVEVRAAAAGTVRNVRDGMEDQAVRDEAERQRVAGRECGNGVLLDHADGWQTQYCHLRKGSVVVREGQAVAAGERLAEVGLSGQTEFPHLHFAVRAQERKIDPFSGQQAGAGCGLAVAPLWDSAARIDYESVALYNAGFAPGAPDIEAIRRGEVPRVGPNAPALVLWVDILGVRAGDRLTLRILAPDGATLFDAEQPIDRTQARRYQFAGTRRSGDAWPAGKYRGEIVLRRETQETRRLVDLAIE